MQVTIKQARIGRKLTQVQMARLLDVSVPTYAKYERNPKTMRYETLERFAAITGHLVSELQLEG